MALGESLHSLSDSDDETGSSARISLSSEFLDESNFITICPNPRAEREEREAAERRRAVDFEFLSAANGSGGMIAADELFSEGKLLPFWQIHHAEKLKRISLKSDGRDEARKQEESRMTWPTVDVDDPSPRPPKCTVLWKELLKLKKQRSSTLSPSNSSSSSSSSSSEIRGKEADGEKYSNRMRKGTRSARTRIRPVLNVPAVCMHVKNAAALPPLFPFRRGKLDR